jgi:hypothetical protein
MGGAGYYPLGDVQWAQWAWIARDPYRKGGDAIGF